MALRDSINGLSNQTGVVASLDGGVMTLSAADGRNITVTESGTGFTSGTNGISITGSSFDPASSPLRGDITLSSTQSIGLGGTTADIGFSNTFIAVDSKGIDTVDVSTVAGAQTAIQRIDAAINSVDSSRAAIGAIENRIDFTIVT